MLKLFGLALAGMMLAACNRSTNTDGQAADKEQPIEVRVHTKHDTVGTTYNGGVAVGPGLALSWDEINIVGKADRVVIQNVIVNRGNCRVADKSHLLPAALDFGQHLDISMQGCDVIQVDVITDQGGFEANFQ